MHESYHDFNQRAFDVTSWIYQQNIKIQNKLASFLVGLKSEQHVQNHNKTTPPSLVYTRDLI